MTEYAHEVSKAQTLYEGLEYSTGLHLAVSLDVSRTNRERKRMDPYIKYSNQEVNDIGAFHLF